MGGPKPLMLVKRGIMSQLNKHAGDTVDATVKLDKNKRKIILPVELEDLLKKNLTTYDKFKSTAPSHQKEFSRWVGDAKKAETRQIRAEKAIQMILAK